MKWKKNNVTTERGNHSVLIAKFDTSDYWFETDFVGHTETQMSVFRRLGKRLEATSVEVKYYFDDNDNPAEPYENIITVVEFYDGKMKFRQESNPPDEARPGRLKRIFKEYKLKDLLK